MSLVTLAKAGKAYLRAEMLASRIRMRTEARRLMLLGLATVLALMALAFLNIGLYAALLNLWGPVWTPLSLAALDLLLALIAIVAAAMTRPGPELDMAEEVKALSGAALEDQLAQGIPALNLLGSVAHGDSSTARLLIPLATTLVGILRKRKEAAKA
jgi:hypothetical protein